MTDPILAPVRFRDHVARCRDCSDPRYPRRAAICKELSGLCATGRELLTAWQRAEEIATAQAEELDAACAQEGGMAWRDDATGSAA